MAEREGEIILAGPETGLSDLVIELSGRDALSVAAMLDLGGLATNNIRRQRRRGYGDSAIMENAPKKLKGKR
jgi:hypothetical protein